MKTRSNLHTPAMEAYLNRQHAVAELMETLWSSTVYETPRYSKALIDAQCFRGRESYAIAEIKSRTDMTMRELLYRKDALFAEKKILAGIQSAKALGVPYIAVLYLVADRDVMWWKVCDDEGRLLMPKLRRWTGPVFQPMTQQMEDQDNVFLPMDYRRHITVAPDWLPPLPDPD